MRLKIWHVPQVPMPAFEVEVVTLREAKLLLDALAAYDQFQSKNRVKPDYCNASGLVHYDEEYGEWHDWEDSQGRSIDNIPMDEL